MSLHDDDPDHPHTLAADAVRAASDRKLTEIDACRAIIRGTMRGITSSGVFNDPLIVVAALGYALSDLGSELLLLSAQQQGRVGYEEAKSAMLNLFGLVQAGLVERMQQLETEMEREDQTRVIRKADVN